jgi:hypothetical protein
MRKPQDSQARTSDEQPAAPAKRKRKVGPEKYHIYHDPKEAGAEAEWIQSLPTSKDPELFIERTEECEPEETFLIRHTRGDGSIIHSWRYTKAGMPETTISLPDESGDDTEEFEEAATSELDEGRIALLLDRVIERRERAKRAEKDQPSALDIAREIEEAAERRAARELAARTAMIAELRATMQPQRAETDQAQTATEIVNSALNIVNTLREASDELSPRESGGGKVGIIGQFASLIDSVGRNAPRLAPVLKQVVSSAVGQQGPGPGAPQQPYMPPQQAQPQESEEEAGFDLQEAIEETKSILEDFIIDLENNRPVEYAAVSIMPLLTDSDYEAVMLNGYPAPVALDWLLSQDAETIIKNLVTDQIALKRILAKPHLEVWLQSFKAKVSDLLKAERGASDAETMREVETG